MRDREVNEESVGMKKVMRTNSKRAAYLRLLVFFKMSPFSLKWYQGVKPKMKRTGNGFSIGITAQIRRQ